VSAAVVRYVTVEVEVQRMRGPRIAFELIDLRRGNVVERGPMHQGAVFEWFDLQLAIGVARAIRAIVA
jgi:hypothetical protein